MRHMEGTDEMTGSGNENIIWSVVDGEAVLLDVSSGRYYSLNPTATEVWTSLQRGESETRIVEAIARAHDVEQALVQRDVSELIAEFRVENLWS